MNLLLKLTLLFTAFSFQINSQEFFAYAQTTALSLKSSSGSGSGAYPLDDEDLGSGRRGSGDGQPSGWRAPPSSTPTSSASRLSPTPTGIGNVGVSLIALPTLPQLEPLATGSSSSATSSSSWTTPTAHTELTYLPCSFFSSRSSSLNSALPAQSPAWLLSRDSSQLPSCQPQQPQLYSAKQCLVSNQNRLCFCVDPLSGRLAPGTEATSDAFAELSCQPLTFRVTIGFREQWQTAFDDPASGEYRTLAAAIERDISRVFEQYAGNQTARVLRFRRGPVLADLIITSVGHPANLVRESQSFKSLLDRRILSNSGSLAGKKLDPSLYIFQLTDGNGNGRNQDVNLSNQQGLSSSVQLPSDARNLKQAADMSKTTPSTDSLNDGSGGFAPTPAVLGAIIGGSIGALALIILLIIFCVYRIRKADEGSYSLDPAKKAAANTIAYEKAPSREFYA